MGFTVDNIPFLCTREKKFLLPSSKLVGLWKKLPKSNALKHKGFLILIVGAIFD